MQFLFWNALYVLSTFIHDEKYLLVAFVVTLIVSMTTAAMFLAKPYESNE